MRLMLTNQRPMMEPFDQSEAESGDPGPQREREDEMRAPLCSIHGPVSSNAHTPRNKIPGNII